MRKFHAMKLLRPGHDVDATTLARFAKEAYVFRQILAITLQDWNRLRAETRR
jgi:hypothetical protein